MLLVPLNDRALPNLPAVAHVAAAIEPVSALPDESAVVVPVPSSKPYAATSPLGAWTGLFTVTPTAAEVVVLPSVSVATAVSWCDVLDAVLVSQLTEYGELVSAEPRFEPSSLNCTFATPRSSAALAVTLTVFVSVDPAAGAVTETVGGAPLSTVTFTVADVVAFPPASRATAVTWWPPFAAVFVFQLVEYGALVSALPRSLPSSLNCTLATPRLSLALAVTLIVPETVAAFAGAVSETVGAVASATTVAEASPDGALALPAASAAMTS